MAKEQPSKNPFHPGTGTEPDHLAGREAEQALLKKSLAAITGPRESDYGPLRGQVPRPLKIVGPRGAGKTALLTWVERVADPKEVDVVRLNFVPKRSSQDVLSGLLHSVANIPGMSKHKAAAQAYKLLQATMRWKTGEPPLKDFGRIMAARLKFRPLLLLLDEVMHYDEEMLSQILQQSQGLANARWPLALVLAGTPALDVHLKKVDATFINRAKNIHINGLDPAATRDALVKPFADRGIAVTDEALELMLSWTDDYPYFTQIVGSEVWEAQEADGRSVIDVELVKGVEQAVQGERIDFYASIYSLIDDDDELLECAMKAVEGIEAASKPLTPRQVRTCIAEGAGLSSKDARNVYNQLLDIGLFWVMKDRRVRAAIPSFFNYFKEEYGQEQA